MTSLMYCERIWRIKLLFSQFVNTSANKIIIWRIQLLVYMNCNKSFHCLDYQYRLDHQTFSFINQTIGRNENQELH